MKTILLLAGRSKRFWPLPDKTLFPLCGKTIAEHQVERLKAGGCGENLIIVTGDHNTDTLTKLFPDATVVEQQDRAKGMQGALLDALPLAGDDSVFIVSGNDVIDPAAYRSVCAALTDGVDGAILAARVTRHFPGGYLTLDGEKITGIVEKPAPGTEPSDLVNIVAHAHRSGAELLATLRETSSERDDAYEVALDRLFRARRYHAVPYDGVWLPIKYPWHLLPLLAHLLGTIDGQHIDPTAQIHPTAVIEGPVIIGPNVRVLPHASIMGPCVLGARSIIASNALVRQASIGEDCVIGFATEVKASALCNHVWTHSTYLGESIIGRNVSFGAGSVTGNLRLDEGEIASAVGGQRLPTGLVKFGAVIGDDCRIGIHAGFSPGVKVGAGTFIASSVLVTNDVPEKSFVSLRDGALHIRPNTASAPQPEGREGFREGMGA